MQNKNKLKINPDSKPFIASPPPPKKNKDYIRSCQLFKSAGQWIKHSKMHAPAICCGGVLGRNVSAFSRTDIDVRHAVDM